MKKGDSVLFKQQPSPAGENGADRVADFLAPLLTPTP